MVTPAPAKAKAPQLRQRVVDEARRLRAAREPKRWVGLDLGSQSLKLVLVEQGEAGLRCVRRLIQELPLAERGQAVDRAGWLQSALKEFQDADVHVSITGPDVAIRRVAMPLMSRQELPEAVKWQVKEQVPFPIQDAVLDFRVIGEVWDKDIKKQDVLIAAAAAPYVEEVVGLVERCGARVASVMPSQFASWRCVTKLAPDANQGTVGVVEIGARKTDVTIGRDGHLRLVRELAVGSHSMTEALVSTVASDGGQLSIDPVKAEAFKRRYGVVTESAEGKTEDGVPLFHLSSLMRPVLEHLLTELSRVLSFYKVQMDEAGVSRLILCGGGASIKQLADFLADGLGVPVTVFNPLSRVAHEGPAEPEQVDEDGPRLAIAFGLAIDHGQSFNLLPSRSGRRADASAAWPGWAKRAMAWAAAMLVGFCGVWLFCGARIGALDKAWDELAPAHARAVAASDALRAAEAEIAQVQRLIDQGPPWEGLFKELAGLVPAGILLEEMTVLRGDTGSVLLKVTGAAAGARGSQGGVSQLMDAMERSPYFAGVDLVSSETRPQDGTLAFRLEAEVE